MVFGLPVEQREDVSTRSKAKSMVEHDESPQETPRRKCEALMNGQVVEPSFANGNWATRWRD